MSSAVSSVHGQDVSWHPSPSSETVHWLTGPPAPPGPPSPTRPPSLPVALPSTPPSGACGPPLDELQAPKTNASITMEAAPAFRRTFMAAMLAHDAAKDNSRARRRASKRNGYGGNPESPSWPASYERGRTEGA